MKKLFIILITTVLSITIFISIGMSIWFFKENSNHSDGNIIIEGYSKVGTINVSDSFGNQNQFCEFQVILTQNDIYLNNQPIVTFTPDQGVNINDVEFKYRVIVPNRKTGYNPTPLDDYIYVRSDTLPNMPSYIENDYCIYEGVWFPLFVGNNNYTYNANFSFGYKEGKIPDNNVKFLKDTLNGTIVSIEFYALRKGTSIR